MHAQLETNLTTTTNGYQIQQDYVQQQSTAMQLPKYQPLKGEQFTNGQCHLKLYYLLPLL